MEYLFAVAGFISLRDGVQRTRGREREREIQASAVRPPLPASQRGFPDGGSMSSIPDIEFHRPPVSIRLKYRRDRATDQRYEPIDALLITDYLLSRYTLPRRSSLPQFSTSVLVQGLERGFNVMIR